MTPDQYDRELKFPLFRAEIDPDLRFFGFDLTIEKARGTVPSNEFPRDKLGWFFVIQEVPGEARFGMDISYEPTRDTNDNSTDDPRDNWPALKPYVAHIHIKDAKTTGQVVPAGQGDGHIPEILKNAWDGGYRGFLTLEPHLNVAGHSHGETGPDLFKVAADALKDVCRRQGIQLAGA